MSIQFPDIASYQGDISLTGLDAVIIKATQAGDTPQDRYENPNYASRIAQAEQLTTVTAAYHYLTPGSMIGEAEYCYSIVGPHLALMIDMEASKLSVPDAVAFTKQYRAIGGLPRLVYLPNWYWVDLGRPDLSPLQGAGLSLVSSNYPDAGYTVNGPGWEGYGGMVPVIWQYTDNATVNGVHPVDMNAFRGSVAELYQLLYGGNMAWGRPKYAGRQLVSGLSGTDVRTWQARMKTRGWTIGVDGQYGPQSQAVAHAFQQDSTAHNWPLADDGVVGPATWQASFERPIS